MKARALLAAALIAAGATGAAAAVQQGTAPPAVRAAPVRVHQQIIIRVPRMAAPMSTMTRTALPPINWIERRGEQCVPLGALAGAAITRSDSVDLVLSGGKRVRARLARNCPTLDFYSGFYLRATRDGLLCADRDTIRARSGGECDIERFRTLVPGR